MEYISINAVFPALSESGTKKMACNCLGPVLAKILLKNSIFLSVHTQYIHSL